MKRNTFRSRYRIGEVAALTGLTPDALRYYERLGLLPPPRRTKGGFRLYTRATFERLDVIKHAQELGLGLGEIRKLVRSLDEGGHHPRQQERLAAVLDNLETKMRELREFRRLLRCYCKDRSQPAAEVETSG